MSVKNTFSAGWTTFNLNDGTVYKMYGILHWPCVHICIDWLTELKVSLPVDILIVFFPVKNRVFVALPACGKVGSPSLTVDCSFKQSTMPCGVPVPMYLPAGVKQLGEEDFPLVIGQSAAQQWAAEKQGQSWAWAVQTVKDRCGAGQGFKPAVPSCSCTPLCRSSLTDLLANCEEAGILRDWRRCLRFYLKVGSGEEPVSGSLCAARR